MGGNGLLVNNIKITGHEDDRYRVFFAPWVSWHGVIWGFVTRCDFMLGKIFFDALRK